MNLVSYLQMYRKMYTYTYIYIYVYIYTIYIYTYTLHVYVQYMCVCVWVWVCVRVHIFMPLRISSKLRGSHEHLELCIPWATQPFGAGAVGPPVPEPQVVLGAVGT